MYKTMTINGKDYKLEFTIEASLCHECIEKISGLVIDLSNGDDMKQMLSGVSDIPYTALVCFYAGLLEHHGSHPDGDKTVPDMNVAKRLAVSLLRDENSGIDNWYDLFTICVDQMGEDGFFDLVGLSSIIGTNEKKSKKVPQDHKKKQMKVIEA